MKHLLFFILTIISINFISCKKEVGGCMDPVALNYAPDADFSDNSLCSYDCSCGYITDDNNYPNYTLSVKNICSGNTQTFYVTYDVWFNNYVGDYFCFSNVSSW